MTIERLPDLAALTLVLLLTTLAAQAQTWIQIEARPTEARALDRVEAYAERLEDVHAFRLASGWYAVVLGPYEEDAAAARLLELRLSRAIPRDSFLSDGANFRDQVFSSRSPTEAAPVVAAPTEPVADPVPAEETEAEARAAERRLDRAVRELVQIALRYEGFYRAAIDGDFGAGTRRAMAAWQSANGFEETGVLSSRQRAKLIEDYERALAELDIRVVTDTEAGIEVAMPRGLIDFTSYNAPFAIYGEEPPRVLLISQIGDADTLKALYDILQTLEIMPLEGRREFRQRDFVLSGQNARISSHAYARLYDGTIKGFVLVWPADDEKRRRLVLDEMAATFEPIEDAVLPDTVSTAQDIDLMAGLKIRRPDRVRSGFFVSEAGDVLTTAEAVEGCASVTLDGELPARVMAQDTALGAALLQPQGSVAPRAVARLSEAEPRLASEIAVSGFSFGGLLGAPSLTWGTFDDNRGLDGDRRLARLGLPAEAGDAGGPVVDAGGAVAGMLLAEPEGARRLPEGVAFAASAEALEAFLDANGIRASTGAGGNSLTPAELRELAAAMTVMVSCWN